MKNYINKRRQFIKNISMTALGATSLSSSILSMKTWAAAAANNSANSGDYKALVCLQFFGGNDGWNMLAPKENSAYQEYATSRENLALTQQSLLAINPINNLGPQLGLHPNMPEAKQLFDDGKLAFLCNIGTKLVRNTTITDFQNQINLPLSLMGKIADMLGYMNENQNIPMNISMFTSPPFMKGEETTNFTLSQYSPANFRYVGGQPGSFLGQRSNAFQEMFAHDYGDAFYNNYNRINREGTAVNLEYTAALAAFNNSGGITTPFSPGFVSNTLKMVARSIAIGEELGLNRQIFFVHVPAFDNHKDLLFHHGNNMKIVSKALMEFQTAMEELEKEDSVVTFSISDFGRTLTANLG